MPYGIRVYNEYGEILIDSDYEMMHLHSEQDFSTSENRMAQTLSFDGVNNQPIIMASVIDGQAASITCRVWKTGALWDRVDVKIASGTSAKTIRVWIFTRGEGGDQTYGIRVYKSDGVLSFDASRKMTRFHASFSGTVANEGTNIHDFTALVYAPPVNINRRYLSAWWQEVDPIRHLGYAWTQYLAWKLTKDGNNNFYRIEISLTNEAWAYCSGFSGYQVDSLDYSGFVFKYQ